MRSLFSRGLRRPRVFLTVFAGLGIVGLAGGWMYQSFTRVGSAYAYVRGDVVLIGAPIEGQIATVEVQPGQRVKQGDVLARLTDGGLRAEVDRARAVYQRAHLAVDAERRAIEVERQRIAATRVRLNAVVSANRAQARAALATARHAERVADRAERLLDREALALADQDQASSLAEASVAEAAHRRAELQVARADRAAMDVAEAELAARVERVALLEAEAETARAALAAAEGRLDLTIIRAQHDGRITRRILAPGASIKMGDPLLEMWLDGPVAVEAWIDEKKLGRIHVGGRVRVSFQGLTDAFDGHISSMSMVTDEEVKSVSITVPVGNRLAKSRWVRVYITIENPDERLMPGLSADVLLPRDTPPPEPSEPKAEPPATAVTRQEQP